MRRSNRTSNPTTSTRILFRTAWCVLMFGLITGPGAIAQDDFNVGGFGQSGEVFGDISFGGLVDEQQEPVTWNARYFASGTKGRLEIEASLGLSWHIYSTTQAPGGPLPTKFAIASPKTVSVAGAFEPSEPPAKSISKIYPGITIEEHDGIVIWSAPITVASGFESDIKVGVDALVCQNGGSCMPAKTTLTATYAGPLKTNGQPDPEDDLSTKIGVVNVGDLLADASAEPTTFRDEDYEVEWKAGVSRSIAAGEQGYLVFRAKPEADYHVYKGVVDDAESSTNFVITDKGGLRIGGPNADKPVISKSLFPPIPGLPPTPPVQFHDGEVTWALPIEVPANTKPGKYEVKGFVCYQACTDKSCLQPMAMEFTANIDVAESAGNASIGPIEIKTAKFRVAIDKAAETKWVDRLDGTPTSASDSGTPDSGTPGSGTTDDGQPIAPEKETGAAPNGGDSSEGDSDAETTSPELASVASGAASATSDEAPKASLPFILLLALAGGLILNLMPCVLPVIGLKIMSFAKQAGEDRGRVVALNFVYVAGIMTVFAGLAVLAVVFSFGWGQQFAYFPVRIGLTVMIFALALSYLGVWEIPTPSIATGKQSDELQNKEGLVGAFFTGAFATVLATPCSGPFLGVALAYTIHLNWIESAAVIMTVGLGMSLPYILLGIFPSAIGFLPKPGNWMVTLKEFLAFLFLGTVAYFFNQFSDGQKLPVFVTLVGVWFGCWIIGKVPPWESPLKRLRGWTLGIGSAAAIGWLAFVYLEDNPDPIIGDGSVRYVVDDHVRWEEYNEERLLQYQAIGKTVMLDFTAAWCPNCILNTQIALDTQETNQLLKDLDAVPMLADMTDLPEDIVNKLENEFGSKSIPLLVIYPGSTPGDPIVLRDIVTQSMVSSALKEAGPSQGASTIAGNPPGAERFTSMSTSAAAQSH